MQCPVGKQGHIVSSHSIPVVFLSGESMPYFSNICIFTINFQVIKGGRIGLIYAEQVDMSPVFLPGLLSHACYMNYVSSVRKTRLLFSIVHKVRNSLVILDPYENMRGKLL